jgi:hypothetical protein
MFRSQTRCVPSKREIAGARNTEITQKKKKMARGETRAAVDSAKEHLKAAGKKTRAGKENDAARFVCC